MFELPRPQVGTRSSYDIPGACGMLKVMTEENTNMPDIPWGIFIQTVLVVAFLVRLEVRLSRVERELIEMRREVNGLILRMSLIEQRMTDWIIEVRGWRTDEDERLGNHHRRLETLEKQSGIRS